MSIEELDKKIEELEKEVDEIQEKSWREFSPDSFKKQKMKD